MGRPSIFPTGVTKFDKQKTNGGYTLFSSFYGATLIDMNGRIVKNWDGMGGSPLKPLPNGNILGSTGDVPGSPGASSNLNAVQIDWDENVMAACHHHDFEREGTPAGYYTPDSEPKMTGNMLLLTHNKVRDIKISDKLLLDERIIEVDEKENIIWEWNSHEHIEEMGLDEAARKAIYRYPMMDGDWIHLNAIATLGENQHYSNGDDRFAPENIICSSRQLNIMFIIEKKTGAIVWRVGPDYLLTPELQKLGQIIGQHHVHMIPKGLPGAGNILVFDNGSFGGYGPANGCAPLGTDVVRRHYSRVIEFCPVTLEIKWEYMKAVRNERDVNEMNAHTFFSPYISSAQRLVNGNTLITEGADGILIEVTPEKDIVWEFVNPIAHPYKPPLMKYSIYRAYRVPYSWVPQLERPVEIDVIPPDIENYRVPGSFGLGDVKMVSTKIKSTTLLFSFLLFGLLSL